MNAIWPLAAWGVLATGVLMMVMWSVSLLLRDASIVDRVWGLTFVVQAWVYVAVTRPTSFLPWLMVALVSIWGLRLSVHIHLRNRGQDEDYRYARMREEHGDRFWWYSLFSVFLLQGAISLVVAAPVLMVIARQEPVNGLGLVAAGVAVWLLGFVFEALGDWQLARFKASPENRGKLLTTGLWSLTRHPNYFGDATLWWGYFLIAASVQDGWISAFGPLLMSVLIRFVSGVSMMEKDQIAKRPNYAEYIRSTPAFFPRVWPSASSGCRKRRPCWCKSSSPRLRSMCEFRRRSPW